MSDTIALMVVLYFSYKGEKAPDQPELGPFRIRKPALKPALNPAKTTATTAVAPRPARRR